MEKVTIVSKDGGSFLFTTKKSKDPDDLLSNPFQYLIEERTRRSAQEKLKAIEYFERSGLAYAIVLNMGVKEYGHGMVDVYGVSPEVRKYCSYIGKQVGKISREEGLKVAEIDLAETCKWDREKEVFVIDEHIRRCNELTEKGYTPLSWGTVADVVQGGYKIVSVDDSTVLGADRLNADLSVMFMGNPIYEAPVELNPKPRIVKILKSVDDIITSVNTRDKTGGIKKKLEKLQWLAQKRREIVCRVVDGSVLKNIYATFLGKNIGTLINPYAEKTEFY